MREEFEKWARSQNLLLAWCSESQTYWSTPTRLMWEGWRAAEPVYDQSVVKRLATQMGWTPPEAPARTDRQDTKCSECKGSGNSDGRDGALIPCLACAGKGVTADRQGVQYAKTPDAPYAPIPVQGVALSFEDWWNGWHDPNVGHIENSIQRIAAHAAWSACKVLSRASSSRAEAQAVPGWEAPCVIDHTHANQAYVTLGFSSEAECKRFIKAIRYGRPNIAAAEAPNKDKP